MHLGDRRYYATLSALLAEKRLPHRRLVARPDITIDERAAPLARPMFRFLLSTAGSWTGSAPYRTTMSPSSGAAPTSRAWPGSSVGRITACGLSGG
jgi:hypothetical protein